MEQSLIISEAFCYWENSLVRYVTIGFFLEDMRVFSGHYDPSRILLIAGGSRLVHNTGIEQ